MSAELPDWVERVAGQAAGGHFCWPEETLRLVALLRRAVRERDEAREALQEILESADRNNEAWSYEYARRALATIRGGTDE